MMRRYFGTDGVRGVYGSPEMNEAFACRLVRGAADFLAQKNGGTLRHVVVGRDTRASGESLAATVIATLVEAGLRVDDAEVVPTPAIAGAVKRMGAQMGIAITASHNPARDNGIKFFGKNGRKLTDADEEEIERLVNAEPTESRFGNGLMRRADVLEGYISAMEKILPEKSLEGWRIVVDTAHGATCWSTPAVLRSLGAELEMIGHRPNGHNINAGVGSLHPGKMAAAVRETGARLGVAHDGDGDRLVLADETGEILDGDDILAILGVHALRNRTLSNQTLIATVQSNLGLDRAIAREGGRVVRTAVGDRYVLDGMSRENSNLGGESTGHLIFPDHSPTGDGLVGALKVIKIMQKTGEPLSRLRRCWQRYPQVTADLNVTEKRSFSELSRLTEAISEAETRLGGRGRVLVRYSGTEPKLRLLVEGEETEEITNILHLLQGAAVVELALVSG